jgi:hypothetical protein
MRPSTHQHQQEGRAAAHLLVLVPQLDNNSSAPTHPASLTTKGGQLVPGMRVGVVELRLPRQARVQKMHHSTTVAARQPLSCLLLLRARGVQLVAVGQMQAAQQQQAQRSPWAPVRCAAPLLRQVATQHVRGRRGRPSSSSKLQLQMEERQQVRQMRLHR